MALCYARWTSLGEQKYRDQTIIKLDDCDNNWDLYASIVLLNPGSAVPQYDEQTFTSTLAKLNLPYFINQGQYFRFKLDPLMRSLVEYLADNGICTGVIKIYNLFNLRNPNSGQALNCYGSMTIKDNPYLHTDIDDIVYDNKPVILAHGQSYSQYESLQNEINKKYIQKAQDHNIPIGALHQINQQDQAFAFIPYQQNQQIYHPSYTFNYGNKTIFTDESCF